MHPSFTPFWERLHTWGDLTAVVDVRGGVTWSYTQLARAVEMTAARLRLRHKGLVFLHSEPDVAGLVCYLGNLRAGNAVHLSTTRVDHPAVQTLVARYQPELILWKSGCPGSGVQEHYEVVDPIGGYQALRRIRVDAPAPHNHLALVLSTSASTGTSKFVRLSLQGINAACSQVAEALQMTTSDRGLAYLPLGYVYGLSVVNSHLYAGGSLVVDKRASADRMFWKTMEDCAVTTLPGVSLTYEFMRQVGAELPPLRSLRKLLHSGDRLAPSMVSWIRTHFGSRGVETFLMYGQTEASGRISVLPPSWLDRAAGSVGLPVKFGRVSICADREVVYCGPNVMLGYAAGREDLCRADELQGRLYTGDSGYLDERGLLYITGRLSRLCKINGHRVSLDDVEAYFHDVGAVAVVAGEGCIVIFFVDAEDIIRMRAMRFAGEAALPPQCIVLRRVSTLPRTSSGKISYSALMSEFGIKEPGAVSGAAR
jgi:long-chain acyl-CoA synthetase